VGSVLGFFVTHLACVRVVGDVKVVQVVLQAVVAGGQSELGSARFSGPGFVLALLKIYEKKLQNYLYLRRFYSLR